MPTNPQKKFWGFFVFINHLSYLCGLKTKYMNWYNTFYWVTRADSVKSFFDVTSDIFTWIAVLSFIVIVFISASAKFVISENNCKTDEEEKTDPDVRGYNKMRKYFSWIFYVVLGLSLVTWAGYVFVPTKKEALLIMAGGGTMEYLTTDSTAKQIPHEMTNFVVTELKSMAQEAKVDLGIANQKDKILDDAKKMSTTELMEKMKVDSNFANIILNK